MIDVRQIDGNNVIIYTPSAAVLPAMVFIPGIGEQNTDINGMYIHGPLSFIKNGGWQPDFIVIGLQPKSQWLATPDWIEYMLRNLINMYNIDLNRICLTGLSAGAKAVFDYVTAAKPIKPASIIGLSIDLYATPEQQWRALPAWGLCGDQDYLGFFPVQFAAWKAMQASGWPNKPWTTMVGYNHGNWNDFYNPAYVDPVTKTNFYTWFKQFKLNIMALPIGRIEAEQWFAQNGTVNETTTDTGGGQNIAYVDPNDWLEYQVDIPADGNYKIDLRVANATTTTNKIGIKQNGVLLTTVNVPPTGGWQAWTIVTAIVPLKKGVQTIRIDTSTGGWNLNWINIAQESAVTVVKEVVVQYMSDGSFKIKQ